MLLALMFPISSEKLLSSIQNSLVRTIKEDLIWLVQKAMHLWMNRLKKLKTDSQKQKLNMIPPPLISENSWKNEMPEGRNC